MGERAVAVWELGVGVPVACRLLVAVVELHQSEEAAVEGGGGDVEVGEDILLGHAAVQLVPRAPPRRHGEGRERLLIYRCHRPDTRTPPPTTLPRLGPHP